MHKSQIARAPINPNAETVKTTFLCLVMSDGTSLVLESFPSSKNFKKSKSQDPMLFDV
jgi:hypothetical protein